MPCTTIQKKILQVKTLMNKILVYIYKRFFKKMNKLFLLFLCLIISKTSAQLLNDNYDPYGGACGDNMDLLEPNYKQICVPSNINNGCSGSSKLSGCLTLHEDGNDCLPHLVAKKFLFTTTFIIYICAENFCEEPIYDNSEWQNIKVSAGCPHPTSNQCNNPGEQFTSGISMCGCPSETSVNIPSTCKVNLEQGTCEVAFMVDDTDNKGHHDIFCTSPKDECNLVNSEVPPHCEVKLLYNCQYEPDFFYVYGADTSQESARCCPNPYSYKNDQDLLTIDHIPGGCPAPVDEISNTLLTNMDGQQPCEERGKTALNKGIRICCPSSDSKHIPGGCPVNEFGTCRHGKNDDGNTCLTPYDDPSSGTISSATTSTQLIEADISKATLEAAFRTKGGVVLDSSTTVDQLGVVSADKLKAAYQNKDGTCS